MSEANPHEELVLKLWTKYVKSAEHGLPNLNSARLSGDIKSKMFEVAIASNGDKTAIKAVVPEYLKARGRDIKTGAKIEGAEVAPKPKKEKPPKEAKSEKVEAKEEEPKKKKAPETSGAASTSKDPAKDALIAAGATKALKGNEEAGIPRGNIDLRVLKRQTLKGMAIDLGAKYKKSLTDDELRARVARKMVGMDSVATAAIAAADPAKVEGLTDCIGVLVDLTKAVCITCPAQEECRTLFVKHKANGFKVFDGLRAGETAAIGSNGTQTAIKVSGPKLTVNPEAEKKGAPTKIEVLSFGKVANLSKVKVDGIEVDAADHKGFLIAVKKNPPGDLRLFNDLVLAHYETEDAPKTCKWFLTYCVAVGAIKLV